RSRLPCSHRGTHLPETASRIMPRLRRLFRPGAEPHAVPIAGPLRGELLGAEHFADRIRSLASSQRLRPVSDRRLGTPLLRRLDETWAILEDSQRRLSARGPDEAHIGPAGEWLLDNFHVVREHIREIREALPRGY